MAWEFRKLGPGDNVAVEAQRDPFAAPKWAPPVWHMPEGLVLLVNLVRALVRTVVFLVRNIVPVSAVAGLGWLGVRFGWLVPVLVLALVAVGLSVWAGWTVRPSSAGSLVPPVPAGASSRCTGGTGNLCSSRRV